MNSKNRPNPEVRPDSEVRRGSQSQRSTGPFLAGLRRPALLFAGALALALTGCGTAQNAAAPPSAAPPGSHAASGGGRAGKHKAHGAAVATVQVNRAAEVLTGTSKASSASNEATFTLTADNANGAPVKGAKVVFYIGSMKPLGNTPPTQWFASGSSGAKPYVASYTPRTNAGGQATLTLYGQPAGTMEMVAVRIGRMSTYSPKLKRAGGLLDAWWTTPGGNPAPGSSVGVSPFIATVKPGARETVTVTANGPNGPIPGALVTYTRVRPRKSGASGTGMGNSGSSSGSSGMKGTAAKTARTDKNGQAQFTVKAGKGRRIPVRIVVTQGSGTRVAGGVNVELVMSGGGKGHGKKS